MEAEAERDNEEAGDAGMVVMTLHEPEQGTVSSTLAALWGHVEFTQWPRWAVKCPGETVPR